MLLNSLIDLIGPFPDRKNIHQVTLSTDYDQENKTTAVRIKFRIELFLCITASCTG